MTFGERLKELRERAGLTQAAVWEACAMPRSTYLKYEQGQVAERVPFTAVVAIAKALGVSCEAFADCDLAGQVGPAAAREDVASEDLLPPPPLDPPVARRVGKQK